MKVTREKAITVPSVLTARIAGESLVRNLALVVAGSLLLALSARVAIPMFPVPMTLQPLALLLIGAALGSWRGASAAGLYLLQGLSGLPVFAGGLGGPAVLMGPTAGYLLAFPAAAFIAGWISERAWGRSFVLTMGGMTAALAVVHLGGWAWLSTMAGMSAKGAFLAGVAPFWAGDVVKIAIATLTLPFAEKIVARFSA